MFVLFVNCCLKAYGAVFIAKYCVIAVIFQIVLFLQIIQCSAVFSSNYAFTLTGKPMSAVAAPKSTIQHLRQDEPWDCGLTCVLMVLR